MKYQIDITKKFKTKEDWIKFMEGQMEQMEVGDKFVFSKVEDKTPTITGYYVFVGGETQYPTIIQDNKIGKFYLDNKNIREGTIAGTIFFENLPSQLFGGHVSGGIIINEAKIPHLQVDRINMDHVEGEITIGWAVPVDLATVKIVVNYEYIKYCK